MKEQYTKEPWTAMPRNWRNEPDPHNWYVSGDHREPDPDDPDDCGTCTGVAVVVGNPTAGPAPGANARRICACVNACEGISTEELESLPGGLLAKLLEEYRGRKN